MERSNEERMERGLAFIISGPAGTGKGTVVSRLRELMPSLGVSVSATTRAPRPGEVDGQNYHFISRERFEELIRDGGVLEYTEYCGNLYGTLRCEAERSEHQIPDAARFRGDHADGTRSVRARAASARPRHRDGRGNNSQASPCYRGDSQGRAV